MINYRNIMKSSAATNSNVLSSIDQGNMESSDISDTIGQVNRFERAESIVDDTRASSKQVYPYISCLSQESPIYCFILSVWDNIVGPQTVYVWKKKNKVSLTKALRKSYKLKATEFPTIDKPAVDETVKSNIDQLRKESSSKLKAELNSQNRNLIESTHLLSTDGKSSIQKQRCLNIANVVKYVTEHSVGVSENNNVRSNKLISLLLNTPNQNIIVMSVKFSVAEEVAGVPYCLSMVFPSNLEHQILPLIDFCSDYLIRVAVTCRLLITKEGFEGGSKIQGSLMELCDTLSSLQEAGLNQYPISDWGCQPPDRRMAERMLTSTLQTMGTTLVVADSPSSANRVVMWLAQFMSKEDLPISRIALSDYQWPYQPGITIQAVIRDSSGGIDLSSSKLLSSKRPLTLIDLTSNNVRQMAPINVHSKNSETAFRQQLLALWHDLDHVPAPSHSLFESVENCSSLVKKFLDEWDRLSSCEQDIRRKFCSLFLRSLQYTALACIIWVKNQWPNECSVRKPLLQVLLSTFLLDEPDLKVVLAQAELMEPGFTSMVLES